MTRMPTSSSAAARVIKLQVGLHMKASGIKIIL